MEKVKVAILVLALALVSIVACSGKKKPEGEKQALNSGYPPSTMASFQVSHPVAKVLLASAARAESLGAKAAQASLQMPSEEAPEEVSAPANDGSELFQIGMYRFDPLIERPQIRLDLMASNDVAEGFSGESVRPVVFKFAGKIRQEWLDEVSSMGVDLIQYQPNDGYLAFVDSRADSLLRSDSKISFFDEFHGAYKVDQELEKLVGTDATLTLGVVFFDLATTGQKISEVLSYGARLAKQETAPATSQWKLLHYCIFENFNAQNLASLLNSPEVYNAYVWHTPSPEGERAAQITAGNYTGTTPSTGYYTWLSGLGADGTGVKICVADTGLDTGNASTVHLDVRGRVQYSALCASNNDTDGHGTNTTSIATGDPRVSNGGTGVTDGGGFYYGSGSAPRAGIWSQTAIGACTYNADANTLANDAVANGSAHIGSHSFTDGLGSGTAYNAQCAAWDARVRDAVTGTAGNQPYAVIFSAGNSGPSAGTLTSPKAAKNIVTVGATENYRVNECPGTAASCGAITDIDTLVSFSSRGPTSDGRIKPDVCAPGHVIAGMQSSASSGACDCDGTGGGCCDWSVGGTSPNQYCKYSGTSQACPRIAGASGIVFDWYQNLMGSFPSPAMNKAILINGAVDMKTADIPNSNEGWGRSNLKKSLQPGVQQFFNDQANIIGATGSGGEYSVVLTIPSATQPVKATLVWTDAPGATSCNPCLVNNLNLTITQGATTYLGNVFSGGWSTTGGTADSLNNIECIYIPAGTLTGTVTLKVTAATLNGDGVPGNADTTDQDFALVVTNAQDCVPPSAPAGLTATGNGNNRIDLSWGSVAGVTEYRIYRSLVSGGPYTYLNTVTAPTITYIDQPVSGGVTYYYVVRAFLTCESANSAQASASTTGSCTLPPAFAGITSVANDHNSTCTLLLGWSAGTAYCGGPLTYRIYRDTVTPFSPGAGNIIATGVSGTAYTDNVGLVSGTTYYYIVRAYDAGSAAEDTNSVTLSGKPTGPITPQNITETFEGAGGFDNSGWTHAPLSGTTDWTWSTAQAQTPTHSWFAQDISTVSDKVLVSPSFGCLSNTTVTFYHRYTFEGTSTCYDGGTLEYAPGPSYSTWTVVPDSCFIANGFNGTVSTGFSNPIGGKRAWCFSLTSWTQVSVNLSTLAGQDLKIRWHEGDDSSTAGTGWYVDSVIISNAGTEGTCTTGSGCTAPGPPSLNSATGTCNGVNLSWTAGTGTTLSYNVYRKSAPCGGTYTILGGMPTTGTTFTDTSATAGTSYAYIVRGACDASGATESADSNCLTATRLSAPTPSITGPNMNACPATMVGLTTESGQSNYKWYRDGAEIAGATTSSYTATISGEYTVSYSNGMCTGTSAPKSVSISTCQPNIMYLTSGPFTQITGDGDAWYERGEKWSVQVTLTNSGTLAATGVSAGLAGNGITVCNNPGAYGALGVGGSASYTYQFVISDTFACGEAIGFDITGKSCNELTPAGPDEMDMFSVTVGQQTAGSPTDLVIQPPVADTYVNEQIADTNYGTATNIDVARRSGRNRRTLMQFDLSGIPAGATINSATLEMYANSVPTASQTLDVHHITETWAEGSVTWNTQPAFDATANASITGGTTAGWKIWTVTPVVQAWLDSTYANYGFLVKCNLETLNTAYVYSFSSREAGTNTPILRVNYTPAASWDCSYTGSGTCTAALPPEIGTQSWTGLTSQTWPVETLATSGYRLYRGQLAGLPELLLDGAADSCLRATTANANSNTASSLTEDPALLSPGDFYWYLVTGASGTGEGPAGNATAGPRTVNSSGVCP